MAPVLFPTGTATATALVPALSQDTKSHFIFFSNSSTSRATSQRNFLCSFAKHLDKRNSSSFKCKCSPSFDAISSSLDPYFLSNFPALLQSRYAQLESLAAELPEFHKWALLLSASLAWLYLTATPGVLIGAIDSYLLAPLQLGLDTLTGRRSLKRTDFLIGERLGEGSFGTVYSGVLVPRNLATTELDIPKRGNSTIARRKALPTDDVPGFKEKVILKRVSAFVLYAQHAVGF